MLGILEKISPSELVYNGYISNHHKVRRAPTPKIQSLLLFIFLLFLNQCYSNKLWKYQKRYKESFLIIVSSWNRDLMLVDARAPSIPLLNFPFMRNNNKVSRKLSGRNPSMNPLHLQISATVTPSPRYVP